MNQCTFTPCVRQSRDTLYVHFTGDQWIAISTCGLLFPLVPQGRYIDLPLSQTMFPNRLPVWARVRLSPSPAGSLANTQFGLVALAFTSASLVLIAGTAALFSDVAIGLVRPNLTFHLISFHLLLPVLNQPTSASS